MSQTINVAGVGRVYIKTDAAEVTLCADVLDGAPVNGRTHKVSQDKKHAGAADKNEAAGHYVEETAPGCFVLKKLREPVMLPCGLVV